MRLHRAAHKRQQRRQQQRKHDRLRRADAQTQRQRAEDEHGRIIPVDEAVDIQRGGVERRDAQLPQHDQQHELALGAGVPVARGHRAHAQAEQHIRREIDWEKAIMDDACELNAQLYAPSAPLALQSLIFKIWKTIFDNTAHEKNDTSPVSLQLSILKDMLSYVHEHYPEKISLNDIANAGKISISSCNTIYKKYLKESPIKHLLNYRLMKSCELLIENALSVTEIAFDVGFANTSYYIDTFKKRYGCTPNEYRKRNKLSEIFTPNTDSFL